MLGTKHDHDFTLEELIGIINSRVSGRLPSLTEKQEKCDRIIAKHILSSTETTAIRWLHFKPWSGTNDSSAAIREEIEQQSESEGEGEGEGLIEIGATDKLVQKESKINRVIKGQVDETKETGNSTNETDRQSYRYRFQNGPIRLLKKLLDENGFQQSKGKDWTIYWSSSVIRPQVYYNLLAYQKVNHFPNSFHLTRKDLMNKCISKMQEKFGLTHFAFLPKTYILPQEFSALIEDSKSGHTYIVKPHNRSQGKGITVTSSMQVVAAKLEKYSSLVVSHYIDNPLLINGLKFDLRIYVAILGVNPLRLYMYQEGLARFATEEYDETGTDCENKRYQHLTNYSVNKKNTDFIKSQNDKQDYFGSKWSLSALRDFLDFNIGKSATLELFEKIEQIIVKTIISGENILYSAFTSFVAYNDACFEVLGFDILIDSNLKPWLVEVNMSPSMNSDSPLDIKIKGSMIADLFTLTGITPLALRYHDGSHQRNQLCHFLKPDTKNIELGPVEKYVLKEIKAQLDRCGGWKRVFPAKDTRRYKQFFEVDRYFNRLLRQQLQLAGFQTIGPIRTSSISRRIEMSKINKQKQRESHLRQYETHKQIINERKSSGSIIVDPQSQQYCSMKTYTSAAAKQKEPSIAKQKSNFSIRVHKRGIRRLQPYLPASAVKQGTS